ncbi:Lon-insertion domain-containing protein [Shewanella fodinae]|uniref:Lon-insertion domain-containing protein n=1 Tax=Shewanella fodinae TaxID=552357 RepID=UPI0016734442|nr:Lon-insertion domain-containing protein [Shewanella fodinae]MCL2905310.1 AAA family ATPase [Shewanella fodinae]GGY87022.1 ATP-dependent protease [Shewanella fodinae]
MNPSLISASNLAPVFEIPTLPPNSHLQDLLLQQQRVLDAFALLLGKHHHAMYLADFPGIHRRGLLQALTAQAALPSHYLHGRILRHQLFGQSKHEGELTKHQILYICIESLLKRDNLWELLLDSLEQRGFFHQGKWQPLKAKVVLVGSAAYYGELVSTERYFADNVALYGEVAFEVDRQQVLQQDYLKWLQQVAALAELSLTQDSLLPLLTYASKQTEHQQRLSLASNDLCQLLTEAAHYAGSNEIDGSSIHQALQHRKLRHNSQEIVSVQNVDDKFIYLPTDGEMIGQINGLTVIDSGDYCYGEPARITASVHYGDGEVADIERKSELGGNIHAKGMMILSGCLYRVFGRDEPLHLNANIVFEQSYQEIDGDSASLAEYCSLISAIAEQPIAQGLAVTGALDQFGNVQAIGGVNEKIEGFFNLCARRGLTGKQGVIMPRSNVQQLNLPQEIIEAVVAGKFHLYEISHVDEAVTLLMNKVAGDADKDGDFPFDTLYGMVQQRLDRLAGNTDEPPGIIMRLLSKFAFMRN